MKKVVVFFACVVISAISHADTEVVDGYTWTYRINGGTAEIYKDGWKAAISPGPIGEVSIPSTLGGKPVTRIGAYAFGGCSGLTSVTIGAGVTSIGWEAFCGCSGLTSVTIPDSVTDIGDYAFSNCSGLTSVTIGNGVTNIEERVFYDCSGLTSVTIPDSVTSIKSSAFEDCSGLTGVTIGNGVTSIGWNAFCGCSGLTSVTIPDGVTYIGDGAFSGCRGLTSMTIPDSVTYIGDGAFNGCRGLASVKIGSGVTRIGDETFYCCSGLTSVTIPSSVTSIGSSAFFGCSGLTSVTIPDSVTSIMSSAFEGCSRLTSVTIGNGVTSIGNYAFSGTPFYKNLPDGLVIFGKVAYEFRGLCPASIEIPAGVVSIWDAAFRYCNSLTSVKIPSSVTSIRSSAFEGCSGLTSVYIMDLARWCDISFGGSYANPLCYAHNLYLNGEKVMALAIPGGVTRIGNYAFFGCSGLASVTMPDSVTSIGFSAFSGCSGLTSVTVPDSVKSIGSSAFDGCSGLTSVTVPDSVTSIGESAFAGCSGLEEISLPFVGGRRGNSGASDSVFGYIFGMSSYSGGKKTRQYYSSGSSIYSYIPSKLKKVVIADETVLGYGAFYNCSGLVSVTIGNGVTSVGSYAFFGCSGIASMMIPDSVTSIGSYAFAGCSGLKSVTIPQCVSSKTLAAVFPDAYKSLESVVLHEGVTLVGGELFSGCASLPSVVIPSSVTRLGDRVFKDCSALQSVTFEGSSPDIGTDIYDGTPRSLVSYVRGGSIGWSGGISRVVPETWNDRGISCDWTVTFSAQGGEFVEGVSSVSITNRCALGALPTVANDGFSFAGWFTAADGGEAATAETVIVDDVTFYAHWTKNKYTVTFDANGGTGGWSKLMDYGEAITAPTVKKSGYIFVGWMPAVAMTVPEGGAVYTAQWEMNQCISPADESDSAVNATAASEYNGCLVDDGGNMKGTIQVKVGKPNARTGLATIKATVQLGAKKVTLKAAGKGSVQIAADGPTELELVGGEECVIVLGADGFTGSYGAYAIDGSRNFFTSKDKAELAAANAVLGKWLGGISILAAAGNFTVTISAKGKAKVSGTLANGKKATGNAVFLIGEEWACVPVALPKANISFALWLPLDGGEVVVSGLGDDVVAGRGGALKAGAAFRIDADEFAAVTGIDALPYLPDGVSVEPKGAKWVVAGGAKAGKVAYKRGTQEVDESKLGENSSGLKLTYKAKDGSFKGSFKVYAEVNGKLKATTVSVSGIVLNGVGYGTATVKGKNGVPVTIE